MDSQAVATATYDDEQAITKNSWDIREGDALTQLDSVEDGSCKLIVTSPPYNIGKEYERDQRLSLSEYARWLNKIIGKVCDKVAAEGHICWQSGNFEATRSYHSMPTPHRS
jgi:DNA modification methylase